MSAIMSLSNRSVSVSEGLRRELMAVVGAAARRMTVIWNGVEFVSADRVAARRALGIADDAFVFLAVGNVLPVKGYDVLLSSAALLDKGSDWTLLIAGRHSDLSEGLIQERGRLGLDDQVQFLGARNDVPALLAAADVFVMPSRNEALPMALLEAMMAGKAVVASAVGGIPEAVQSGVNGLLVTPESPEELAGALTGLIGNRGEVNRLGQAAATSVRQHFGADAMVDAYVREYRLAGARI
jgi:glycosyltransferase involved in cell wall biosynthesis